MGCPKGMTRALHFEQAGFSGRAVYEGLGLGEADRLVGPAVNHEPGDTNSCSGGLDIERGRIPVDVIEHIGIEWQRLAGTCIEDRGVAGLSPRGPLLRSPAVHGGDGRPGYQTPDLLIPGGIQHTDTAAT